MSKRKALCVSPGTAMSEKKTKVVLKYLSFYDILFQHHLYLLHIHLLGWHGGVLGKHLLLDRSVLENCWFLLVVEKRSAQLEVEELGSR